MYVFEYIYNARVKPCEIVDRGWLGGGRLWRRWVWRAQWAKWIVGPTRAEWNGAARYWNKSERASARRHDPGVPRRGENKEKFRGRTAPPHDSSPFPKTLRAHRPWPLPHPRARSRDRHHARGCGHCTRDSWKIPYFVPKINITNTANGVTEVLCGGVTAVVCTCFRKRARKS